MTLKCVTHWGHHVRSTRSLLFIGCSEIPATLRSTHLSVFVAVLCKADDLKQFGYSKVLEPLLRDLKTLEENVACHFCTAERSHIQSHEVRTGLFQLRTKHGHNQHVEMALNDPT